MVGQGGIWEGLKSLPQGSVGGLGAAEGSQLSEQGCFFGTRAHMPQITLRTKQQPQSGAAGGVLMRVLRLLSIAGHHVDSCHMPWLLRVAQGMLPWWELCRQALWEGGAIWHRQSHQGCSCDPLWTLSRGKHAARAGPLRVQIRTRTQPGRA